MKIPRVGVGIVVFHENKILLGKRKGSFGAGEWCCPGGHLEWGESVEECMHRELAEETSLQATSFELGPWVATIFDEERHYITLYTFVHAFECTPQLCEPDKCEGWEWFSLDDLPTPLFATVQKAVESGILVAHAERSF